MWACCVKQGRIMHPRGGRARMQRQHWQDVQQVLMVSSAPVIPCNAFLCCMADGHLLLLSCCCLMGALPSPACPGSSHELFCWRCICCVCMARYALSALPCMMEPGWAGSAGSDEHSKLLDAAEAGKLH